MSGEVGLLAIHSSSKSNTNHPRYSWKNLHAIPVLSEETTFTSQWCHRSCRSRVQFHQVERSWKAFLIDDDWRYWSLGYEQHSLELQHYLSLTVGYGFAQPFVFKMAQESLPQSNRFDHAFYAINFYQRLDCFFPLTGTKQFLQSLQRKWVLARICNV